MDVVLPDEHFGGAPKELICPITQEMMVEPVIAADGYTYEREAIERWLSGASHQRSPTTNAAMLSRHLTANRLVSSMIAAYTSRLGAQLVELCTAARETKAGERRMRQLIEAGADVDARDDAGKSCLVLACSRGRSSTANALLDAGARVTTDEALDTVRGVVEAARRANASRVDETRRTQLKDLLSPPRQSPPDDDTGLLAAAAAEEAPGDLPRSRKEVEALESLIGRLRERVEETREGDLRRSAALTAEQRAQEAAESVARNGRDLVAAMDHSGDQQQPAGGGGGQPPQAGAPGVFGGARLRQRGYFPSLFALQFALIRFGTSREARCTFFAFLDEGALLSATSTHDERASARRLRAAILALTASLIFFVTFG